MYILIATLILSTLTSAYGADESYRSLGSVAQSWYDAGIGDLQTRNHAREQVITDYLSGLNLFAQDNILDQIGCLQLTQAETEVYDVFNRILRKAQQEAFTIPRACNDDEQIYIQATSLIKFLDEQIGQAVYPDKVRGDAICRHSNKLYRELPAAVQKNGLSDRYQAERIGLDRMLTGAKDMIAHTRRARILTACAAYLGLLENPAIGTAHPEVSELENPTHYKIFKTYKGYQRIADEINFNLRVPIDENIRQEGLAVDLEQLIAQLGSEK